ncbi:hypothetical protein PILCRDRAFT_526493 [Piloderma croceum F 1598]|uniref:Uncharacterized protein n=1 Tax=Piloderma croceum (strain F 1598) TaxID=765440 RepID=A0A0C3FLZ2_PILCF|nr:hypothetical protein PILCRDRAFT_526493 [Piloderma croceum F 1598]
MVAYETYAHALITKGHGHPLWQPDPGEYAPVELGDVGYFHEGAFVKLFNASKDIHSWSNRLGLPEGHTPLQVGDIVCKTPLAKSPGYISSEGVFQKVADLNAMTGTSGKAGRVFNFESSKQHGALLMMRDVAYRQDVVNKKPFYDYIIEHHRSWLDFAHASGRDVSQSDLILVDGCDRTSEWACAAWSGESPVKFNFVIGVPGVANESAGLWGRWISSEPLDKNVGPRPLVPGVEATSPGSPLVPPPPFNQCVFLRGFQIGDRTTFFKRHKKRVDLGISSPRSIDFNGFLGPQDDEADEDIEENTPTAAMIGYIFSISIAQFALIHNDDLVDLLRVCYRHAFPS